MRKKMIWLIPVGIVAVAAFVGLGGWIVEQLWNWLLPPMFGLHQVTFWQALGILVLCRILFGGFGMQGSGESKMRRRGCRRMRENMTPEERDRFQGRLDPSASEGQ